MMVVAVMELSPSNPVLASLRTCRRCRRYRRTIEVWYPTEPPTGSTNPAASPCFWDIRGSLPEEQAAKVTHNDHNGPLHIPPPPPKMQVWPHH